MDRKEFICEETEMRSPNEEELVRALQYHYESHHNKSISREEAMQEIKPVSM